MALLSELQLVFFYSTKTYFFISPAKMSTKEKKYQLVNKNCVLDNFDIKLLYFLYGHVQAIEENIAKSSCGMPSARNKKNGSPRC